MGKNLYSDFAVLTAVGRTVDFTQVSGGLRIIPLFDSISMASALKGLNDNVMGIPYYLGEGDPGAYVPLDALGADVSNVTIQHDSDGYVRFVGKLQVPNVEVDPDDPDPVVISHIAKGFALVDLSRADSSLAQGHIFGEIGGKANNVDVLAVASIDRGYDMGNECYVSFTITTVNNYKSVTFNPNAFATMEDLAEINGLDGLHIAFDTKSGDIKLLDKAGKVIDQANLHMDTDTIIAEGEEGYKYVKTDRDQDIHSTKSFMPAGKTFGEAVEAEEYEVKAAALLLDLADLLNNVITAQGEVDVAEGELEEAQTAVANAQAAVTAAQAAVDADDGSDPSASEQLAQNLEAAQSALEEAQGDLESAQSAVEETRMSLEQAQEAVEGAKQAARNGDFSNVIGIRVAKTDYEIGGEYSNSKVGASNVPFLAEEMSFGDNMVPVPVYSPAAFVWTVGKDVGGEPDVDLTFEQQMNANAQALGFHIGDDIPLGTNLPALVAKMSEGDFDAEAYIHGTIEIQDEEFTSDELVDEQRALSKQELVAWNSQHPALAHDGLNGTIISEHGVDIKNGMLSIGNGVSADGHDFPKQFKISTTYTNSAYPEHAEGLKIGVVDASNGVEHSVLTINDKSYISGAPICLALLKCESEDNALSVDVKRITADFAIGSLLDLQSGAFSLNITDNRENARYSGEDVDRIVEIIPVYRSGADATEAVPALQPIHAIGQYSSSNDQKVLSVSNDQKVLSVRCTQVIDWVASLGIGEQSGVVDPGNDPIPGPIPAQSAELYLLVKVY